MQALVLLVTSGALLAADSSWAGVWALISSRAKEDAQMDHVVFAADSATKPRLYLGSWNQQILSESKVTDTQVDLAYDAGGRYTEIHLQRNGNRAAGTIKILHPQYPIEAKLQAVRVLDQGDWQPFGWLESAGPVLDLVTPLHDAARQGADPFVKVFEEKIMPKYFVLFEDLLFDPVEGLSRNKLERLAQIVSESRVLDRTRALVEARKEVLQKVKEKSEAFGFSNCFILMPSLGTFEKQLVVFEHRLAVKVGVDKLDVAPDRLTRWVARTHLTLPMYRVFPPIDDSPTAVTIRQGFAVMFAIKFGFGDDPLQFCDSREAPLTAEELAEAKHKLQLFVQEQVRPNLSVDVMRLVGYQFAQQVIQVYQPEQILTVQMSELFELYRSFLGS